MSNLCSKCSHSVTEPLCGSCIINEVRIWLHDQPINKNKLIKIKNKLNNLLKEINSLDIVLYPSKKQYSSSVMKCIKCKKEMHLLCFYCVTSIASKIIKHNLNNEVYFENFHQPFNTDFYDYELSKENNLFHLTNSLRI